MCSSKKNHFKKLKSIVSHATSSTVCDLLVKASRGSKPISSSFPQDFIQSPTLYLLFISDLFSLTQDFIHSYPDDYTLH